MDATTPLRRLADLDRETLAVLGREWLLHGHLQDRVGMALLLETTDREEMQAVAIEEWMAASPIYSQRMQAALGFSGNSVETILKNLQLDIGAPHEFMDFRYRLQDDEHGEFWLAHCGALMDVEPMGEDFVHGMCHAIEDPTFDATAAATNPLAQVRPIHRPPRRPSDRMPHCHWRIDVVAGAPPAQPHANQAIVAASLLARLPIAEPGSSDGGGWADYSGPFDPEFRLEDLSHEALVIALQEFGLQSHLLLRSYLLSVTQRFGTPRAAAVTPRLLGGWAGLTTERIRDALGLPTTTTGLATLLVVHPIFAPASYLDVRVQEVSEREVRLAFGDCPAAHEDDALTWFTALGSEDMDAAIQHVLQPFDPRVRCTPTSVTGDELHAYRITLDPDAAPLRSAPELAIARISTGARFQFKPRRPLRMA